MPKLKKVRERLMYQRDRFSKELRIQSECLKHMYSSPCKQFQQWECRRNEIGRWRIFKCRGRVAVERQCSCARRRQQRDVEAGNKHSYTLDEEMLLSDWEKLANDSSSPLLDIPESLISNWEDEFFDQLTQKEIIEQKQWHQGVFESADDVSERRQKRSSTHHKTRHEKTSQQQEWEDLFLTQKCITYSNMTVMCQPEVYTDYESWRSQKNSLDHRIRKMRQRLQAAKDVRKHLKEGRPKEELPDSSSEAPEPEQQIDISMSSECSCALNVSSQQHPLRSLSVRYVSDAEVLNYRTARRGNRRGKKHGGRGRKRGNKLNKRYCNIPMMNCFVHDPQHWRTPPFWPEELGDFCFCQNSNNNSYWCLRTVNETHNFLYCEFVTGFVSFYDIGKDVNQLHNEVYQLSLPVLEQLSEQLGRLKACKGWLECEQFSADVSTQTDIGEEKV